MAKNLVGIDIGGTKILIVLISENGRIKKTIHVPTTSEPPLTILNRIAEQLKLFKNFKSIGIGIAGDVDGKNGILRLSPNLPKWKNINLKKFFENRLKTPTIVDNDANCAAYGSYVLDGKRKFKNFIMITLGTGMGGGIIIDGKLYRGASGTAGEIGHTTINPNGPKCTCGNYGCLETYIGSKGIVRMWQAYKTSFYTKNITPLIIANMARKNNKKAQMVFDEFSEYLAMGVSGIINIFNPDMISFSGGVSNDWDIIKKVFFKKLKYHSFSTPLKHVKIIKSKYSNNLGAIGAALLSSGKER
ncbi:MAG: ROK family protein [Elusimicrobia bacterium]|nr:ROK family protein [Elusimicrobiota bacterium]